MTITANKVRAINANDIASTDDAQPADVRLQSAAGSVTIEGGELQPSVSVWTKELTVVAQTNIDMRSTSVTTDALGVDAATGYATIEAGRMGIPGTPFSSIDNSTFNIQTAAANVTAATDVTILGPWYSSATVDVTSEALSVVITAGKDDITVGALWTTGYLNVLADSDITIKSHVVKTADATIKATNGEAFVEADRTGALPGVTFDSTDSSTFNIQTAAASVTAATDVTILGPWYSSATVDVTSEDESVVITAGKDDITVGALWVSDAFTAIAQKNIDVRSRRITVDANVIATATAGSIEIVAEQENSVETALPDAIRSVAATVQAQLAVAVRGSWTASGAASVRARRRASRFTATWT
jgi:hypothetical protein